MQLTNLKKIEACLKLADTNLDTVLVQAEHLTQLMNDPRYKVDIWAYDDFRSETGHHGIFSSVEYAKAHKQ